MDYTIWIGNMAQSRDANYPTLLTRSFLYVPSAHSNDFAAACIYLVSFFAIYLHVHELFDDTWAILHLHNRASPTRYLKGLSYEIDLENVDES